LAAGSGGRARAPGSLTWETVPRWNIDSRFEIAENASIVGFLRRTMPSAHSDVAAALIQSADGIGGVHHYCPAPARYAFVVLHLSDFSIFGLAYGQSRLAYRVPGERIAQALGDGGSRAPELGPRWVMLEPWSDNEPLHQSRRRLARWCTIAAGSVPGINAP